MPALQTLHYDKVEELLDPLIRQEAQVSITHQTPSGWRMFRSSLIGGNAAAGWVTVKPCPVLITKTGTYPKIDDAMTITFRRGHKKCSFTSKVAAVEGEGQYVTIRLEWPHSASQLQRRLCERVSPPPHQVIAVRLWPASEPSNGEKSVRIVRNGQVEDLSVGGIRVKVPLADEFEIGATYCCAFAPQRGDPAVVVDAILRHREATEHGRACLGFQFVGLESSTAGRQTLDILARTVERLHRREARSRQTGK